MWPSISLRTARPQVLESAAEPRPTKTDQLELLSAMDVFADLSQQELETLVENVPMQTARPGAVFHGAEHGPEMLFLLKSGRVELYRQSQDGKKLTLAIVGPGAIFGEMSLIDQRLSGTVAVAIEDSVICALGGDDVKQLMLEHPTVAFRIIGILAERLHQTRDALEQMAFNDVTGRLADLLVRLANPRTNLVEGYSHQDLASMVGCLRESLTVTLNAFKRNGAITVSRKRIEIKDRARLEWVSGRGQALSHQCPIRN